MGTYVRMCLHVHMCANVCACTGLRVSGALSAVSAPTMLVLGLGASSGACLQAPYLPHLAVCKLKFTGI